MPWQSPGNYTPEDRLHSDDLNKLHQDDTQWGGDVNGGGYTLSNVVLEGVSGLATGSEVTSVFTRIGDVVALATDYAAFYVPLARQLIAGPGLGGGGSLNNNVTFTADVVSVFGRTGAITLTPADITNATGVLSTRRINTGLGLSGGGALSADLTLAAVPDSVNQQVQVLAGATLTGTRHAINFVNGANVTVGVVDNPASNRVDVTISSTGGAGGMVDPTTTKGDVIVRGLTVPNRLAVGADGQVLTADSTQALGVKWAAASGGGAVASVFGRTGAIVAANGDYSAAQVTNAVDATTFYNNPPWIATLPWAKITNPPAFMLDPTLAAGDLIVHAATTTRLPVGADGSLLTADSTQAAGMRWGTVAVSSVFGRSGAVVAQVGDYTASMVTNAVATTRNINTSTGLTGGGNLSADRTLSVIPDTTNQQVQILLGGTNIGTRHAINFVNGAGVAMTIADDPTDNRINLTVASSGTGSGGGLVDPTTTKGDLIVRGATAPPQALPVGANGQVLTADNSQLLGMAWTTPTGGGAGSQTPWQSDINAALWSLNFVKGIGVNVTSAPATARILIEPTAAEEGVKTVINTATALASMSVVNDIGDYLRLRSYGTGFAPNPPEAGLTALESSTTVALFASASEVMRLVAGHVLIGTTADDGLHMLQVNGGVRSESGGFTFPDGTTQTTAYTSASSPVTSVFTRTGAVVALAGDYTAAKVTNAVDQTGAYANPAWITSLAWSKITGAPAAAAQTPWTSNINAATFTLYSVGMIGVGNDATVTPDGNTAAHVIVGPTAVAFTHGEITACGNTTTLSASVGALQFANYANTGAEKRVAAIFGNLDGAVNSGYMGLYTWNAGVSAERMRITAAGNVGIGNSATPAPSGSTANPVFVVGSSTANVIGEVTLCANHTVAGGLVGSFNFANYSTTGADKRIAAINGYSDASGGGGVIFYTWNAGAAGERMRIVPSGNVGIGTSSPSVLLDLASAGQPMVGFQETTGSANNQRGALVWDGGSALSVGGWIFQKRTDAGAFSANLVTILNTGAVGIGTLTPGRSLDVNGSIRLADSNNLEWATPAVSIAGVSSANTLIFRTNSAERVRIDANGLVGIGTTAPRSLLSLVPVTNATGPANATQFTIGENSNNVAYGLNIGYFYPGGNGAIQSLANNAGSTLYLNNAGGVVACGGQLAVGAGMIAGSAAPGDISVARVSSPPTGVIWLGNSTNCYLYYDGSQFNIVVGSTVLGGSLSVPGNTTLSGIIYGGAGTLNIPCHYCPPFSSNPVNMFNNTLGFTINEAGNYVTLWVKMSNGTLHIASFTLTTPSFASDKAE